MLEAASAPFSIRFYLQDPLLADELDDLLGKIDGPAKALVRWSDAKKAGITLDADASENRLRDWLARHPETMQRPVLMGPDQAIIGRPPEALRPLIDQHRP